MTRAAAALAGLLAYAVLTLWIAERWAWGAVEFVVFVALGGWALRQIWRPSTVRVSLWLAPLVAAPLWGLVQLAAGTTVYRAQTWNSLLIWAAWATLFFLALQVFGEPAARDWFLRFALYFGFAICVFSTVQMFTGGGRIFWIFPSGYRDFVMGTFVSRNQYAAFLELILPIAMWHALHNPCNAWADCLMAAALFASVVSAASRAGALLMAAEVECVLLLALSRGLVRPRVLIRGFAWFAAAAVVFAGVLGWQVLLARLRTPDPFASRRDLMLSSLEMLRDRPVMGFGLGNWPRAYPGYARFDDGTYVNQAHNDWLQWAVEGGLPFLVILLSLVALAAPALFGSLWGVGVLALWLHCLVEYPLQQRPGVGAWVFVLLAAAYSTDRSLQVQPADQ